MTYKRCLLHKNKLEPFVEWLDRHDIPHRPGKGPWQVLQVMTEANGWQVVFARADMPEHYSVNERLVSTVRKFVDAYRKESEE